MQDIETATVLKYHPDSQATTFYKDDGEELDACHAGGRKFFPIDIYPPTINSKVSQTPKFTLSAPLKAKAYAGNLSIISGSLEKRKRSKPSTTL